MTYVALLRGINVGGNNIIKMTELRAEFEKMGFQAVRTYIQSGNVIFESEEKNARKLEAVIEKRLSARFDYQCRVLVRSRKDLEAVIGKFPKIFEDGKWKHNVIFLSPRIDSKKILTQIPSKEEIEVVTYAPGVIFWSAKAATITRSNLVKLSGKPQYQEMTVRNVNTTRKLLEKMT